MTDEIPVVSDVADVVDEVIPDPIEKTADDTLEGMPPWGQAIIDRIDGLTEKVDGIVPTVEPEHVADPVADQVAPDHGDPVRDSSPARKPWTHRSPFGKD